MFKNYLRIAFRNLLKHRGYSIINILGLTIGIVSCVLILLYIQHELSYDKYHKNSDRIYRVTREWLNTDGSTDLHFGVIAPPIAPLLKNDFPQIEHAVRIRSWGNPVLKFQEKTFYENEFCFADPEIFQVFTFSFIKGSPELALLEPNNIVITESVAHKYFGDDEPINKVLTHSYSSELNVNFKIAGVIKDIPQNSHFHFDIFGSMEGLKPYLKSYYGESRFNDWSYNNFGTYLLFAENYNVNDFIKKIPDFLIRHQGENANTWNILHLQRLTDIHLHSHLDIEFEANGNIVHIYILSAIAFFLLMISCINFMNLSTARSVTRAREIGVRKVVGALRFQIIKQFLSESIIIACIAMLLSAALIEILLPVFNNFVGVELQFNPLCNPEHFLGLIGLALFVGIIAGSYPAFFLSNFRPTATLKTSRQIGSGKSILRQALVIFQFTISIILLISLSIVFDQLAYCKNKKLGLNKDHMIILQSSNEMIQEYEIFKHRLLQHTNVVGVAASNRVPSAGLLDFSGARIYKGENSTPLGFRVANVQVSHDFIDTYEIPLVAGRNFSTEYSTDLTEAFILNETAVEKIGWSPPEDAIGKPFKYGGLEGRIIGVIKDFHYESLHKPITPVVLHVQPNSFNSISIRIQTSGSQDVTKTLDFLKKIWHEYDPNIPFNYSFLDERYGRLYRAENKLKHIFGIYASVAIFIACLGLFGLTIFMVGQRTKEIGIRKVLGASVSGIVFLLTKEFTKCILIANIFAWPVAYYAMNKWLQNFAYRISISWWMFFLAGALALVIAFLTVSYQAIRTATANPVEALRYE